MSQDQAKERQFQSLPSKDFLAVMKTSIFTRVLLTPKHLETVAINSLVHLTLLTIVMLGREQKQVTVMTNFFSLTTFTENSIFSSPAATFFYVVLGGVTCCARRDSIKSNNEKPLCLETQS